MRLKELVGRDVVAGLIGRLSGSSVKKGNASLIWLPDLFGGRNKRWDSNCGDQPYIL